MDKKQIDKRKVLRSLGLIGIVFIGLVLSPFILIFLINLLPTPWTIVSNSLWILGVVILVYYLVREFYRVVLYISKVSK